MAPSSLLIGYKDHDRTPLLYLLREMAAVHEALDVRIEHFPGKYEEAFLAGQLDLVCETFRFLFPARRDGHPVRALAACHNFAIERLFALPDIQSLADLKGKRIAIRATESSRFTSLAWIRHLQLDGLVEVVVADDGEVGRWGQWRRVVEGAADAVITSPLYTEGPLSAGLHELEIPLLPQIGSLYFAALGPFVTTHEDELRRFVRALYRAVFTFHHDEALTLAVMAKEPARLIGLEGEDAIRSYYQALREGLDRKPIPRLESLVGTYEMLKMQIEGLDEMNPLELWDLRYVLELEESSFMETLERAIQ